MVQNTNINKIEGAFQSTGDLLVRCTRFIILTRVVMNQHDGRSLCLKHQLDDLPWMHARAVNSASKELDKAQKPVMGIEQKDTEIFAVSVAKRYRQKVANQFGV